MTSVKVYVEVVSRTLTNGRMLPQSIVWENGVCYDIDRVSDVRQAASMRCGGQGDRYTVWIGGKMSYLYFERNCSVTGPNIGRWFVERKTN